MALMTQDSIFSFLFFFIHMQIIFSYPLYFVYMLYMYLLAFNP